MSRSLPETARCSLLARTHRSHHSSARHTSATGPAGTRPRHLPARSEWPRAARFRRRRSGRRPRGRNDLRLVARAITAVRRQRNRICQTGIRAAEAWVAPAGGLDRRNRAFQSWSPAIEVVIALEIQVIRHVIARSAFRSRSWRYAARWPQPVGERSGDGYCQAVLKREDVISRPRIAVGPDFHGVGSTNELRRQPDLLTGASNGSRKEIPDIEIGADLANVEVAPTLVAIGGRPRGHAQTRQSPQRGREFVSHPIGEVLLGGVPADVLEWQHRNRRPAIGDDGIRFT